MPRWVRSILIYSTPRLSTWCSGFAMMRMIRVPRTLIGVIMGLYCLVVVAVVADVDVVGVDDQ